MSVSILRADAGDAADIAALHADSWRSTYRGMLPDDFLAGPVVENRLALWRDRMSEPDEDRRLVIKAISREGMVGFACVLRDAEPAWGPCLDNLHVKPGSKGSGIGSRLFHACRDWVAREAPGQPMHLWVIEGNSQARLFYDRRGGSIQERRVIEIVSGIQVPELRYVWINDQRA
jgi:GNAT superfamily N-acetyltransferase